MRSLHENENKHTKYTKNPLKMARLDFILAPNHSLSLIDLSILTKYKSNHNPVQIDIKIFKHTRGKSNWKFNNSLRDTKFVKLMKYQMKDTKNKI